MAPAPNANEDVDPNANVDGTEPNAGSGAAPVEDPDENAKPLVEAAGATDV